MTKEMIGKVKSGQPTIRQSSLHSSKQTE